jgi:rRNA processing protein Gar1
MKNIKTLVYSNKGTEVWLRTNVYTRHQVRVGANTNPLIGRIDHVFLLIESKVEETIEREDQ